MRPPFVCDRQAYEGLRAQIARLDTGLGLARAATAISMDFLPDVDRGDVEHSLGDLARAVRGRIEDAPDISRIGHVDHVLYDEWKFEGSQAHFNEPGLSLLPAVLDSKLGGPVVLGILYRLLGERAGLTVRGCHTLVSFHVEVEENGVRHRIDPCDRGRVVSEEDVCRTLGEFMDCDASGLTALISPVSDRGWINWLLRFLKATVPNYSRDFWSVIEMEELLDESLYPPLR